MTSPLTISGIDTSAWQRLVDWAKVSAAGHRFAIIKCSEGNKGVNDLWRRQTDGARAAGLEVGCYHFARPNGLTARELQQDAMIEASRLVEFARYSGRISPMLDLETNEQLSNEEINSWRIWADTFAMEAEGQLGCRIGFYSYSSLLRRLALGEPWSQRPLWLAQYSDLPPSPIAPFPSIWIWQRSGNATVAGVSGPCDLNLMSEEAWAVWSG